VLYDQPIHLARARELVQLEGSLGKAVPLSIAHAPSDAFEGVRVDRRFVVVAAPTMALAQDQTFTFSADDGAPEPIRNAVDVNVADPFAFTEATCGWWTNDDQTCQRDLEKHKVRTDRREIHLLFNNDLRTPRHRFEAHVRVSPPVRNLSVSDVGWNEGRLQVTGDFRASTRSRMVVSGLEDVRACRCPRAW
jgi:hypothetical protein